MQAWQEEVERARHGQRDAESKLSSLEASAIYFYAINDVIVISNLIQKSCQDYV